MPDEDPTLDAALAALAGVEPKGLEENDRWAKRIASRLSTIAPPSRRELDPILEAPFPDDHKDSGDPPKAGPGYVNFDGTAHAADDHAHAAVAAADFGEARGWEGSMSDDDSSSHPPNSLAALSGLTRSGPASSISAIEEGAAKGDDSGLIDLRAMSQPEPQTVEPTAAAPVSEEKPASAALLGKTAPAAPSSISASKIAIASPPAAAVPPSSTTATAASASAATPSRAQEKKGGTVIWLAVGGLAAAAAAAFFVVGPMAKKDEAPTASAPAAAQPGEKKSDEKVAVVEKPAATTVEPQASAAPTMAEEPVAPGGHVAAKPGAAPVPVGGKAGTPEAKATATATAATETPKSAGTGSLDEVLGIGKDQPVKKADPTDNLPDKPDSMDVRSAINGKVSAATACVKGLEAPSNVSVTFGPAGAVSGVVVTSGPAKGTGAESCIKNAFSSAKVPASKKGATGSAALVP